MTSEMEMEEEDTVLASQISRPNPGGQMRVTDIAIS